MKNITEQITVSQQVYPTTSASGLSGSSALKMDQYRRAVAQMYAHRLPDDKGAGVITMSLYETTNTTLNGQEVAASVKTATLNSVTDVYLEAEINTGDMDIADDYAYIYPDIITPTGTVLSCVVIRGEKRYET